MVKTNALGALAAVGGALVAVGLLVLMLVVILPVGPPYDPAALLSRSKVAFCPEHEHDPPPERQSHEKFLVQHYHQRPS